MGHLCVPSSQAVSPTPPKADRIQFCAWGIRRALSEGIFPRRVPGFAPKAAGCGEMLGWVLPGWAGVWLVNMGPTLLPKPFSTLGHLAVRETLYGRISRPPCPPAPVLTAQSWWASPPGSPAHRGLEERVLPACRFRRGEAPGSCLSLGVPQPCPHVCKFSCMTFLYVKPVSCW